MTMDAHKILPLAALLVGAVIGYAIGRGDRGGASGPSLIASDRDCPDCNCDCPDLYAIESKLRSIESDVSSVAGSLSSVESDVSHIRRWMK